ncbi:MAG: hypothetical protein JWO19_4414 [Bryobacterales bacterium]|nr:hypothetical protein [Bryobacterales bacterium]
MQGCPAQMSNPVQAAVLEFPADCRTQTLTCGKCGRELAVSVKTVLAFCRDCSADLGVKK